MLMKYRPLVNKYNEQNLYSPVVAITSKPTKPKKQVAAPAMMPSKPNGAKPPVPQSILLSVQVSFSALCGIFQFLPSAVGNRRANFVAI